jgi:hypothetical protein
MPRSISRVILLCGLLTLTAAAGSCQRRPAWNLAPVEGIITKEGRPLKGIEVVFVPEADTVGPRTSGLTDEAGHYRLRTDGGDIGAAVGAHRVYFHDTHRVALTTLGRLPKEKVKELNKEAASVPPRVPSSYGHPNETPLRVEVHPGPQVIDFDIP